jgi:hypothetical protein
MRASIRPLLPPAFQREEVDGSLLMVSRPGSIRALCCTHRKKWCMVQAFLGRYRQGVRTSCDKVLLAAGSWLLLLLMHHREQGLFKAMGKRHRVTFEVLGFPVVGYDGFMFS